MQNKKLYTEKDKDRIKKPAKKQKDEEYRNPWRRDYARLLHSASFRRLQGKTQLFPNHESDFFRNRLTHSLEVAQIAKSIAIKLNSTNEYFITNPIDTDIVEMAALAHDLGHPPFGHNGEKALDECMIDHGGFEGNAQTLRILSKLEKRQTFIGSITGGDGDVTPIDMEGIDQRIGLNLTFRSLASVLKYDKEIPRTKKLRKYGGEKIEKGYYYTEADLVKLAKNNVIQNNNVGNFKTIECSIMDIADDIAYSTYDLEDAFKANFLNPLSIIASEKNIIEKVANTVNERLEKNLKNFETSEELNFTEKDVYLILIEIFNNIFEDLDDAPVDDNDRVLFVSEAYKSSKQLVSNGYFRTHFTSDLVGQFVDGVSVRLNEKEPALSEAFLNIDTFKKVEVLKNLVYESLIMSSRLKVTEFRGKDVIKKIFNAFKEEKGELLLPDDFLYLYNHLKEPDEKERVICDFIAGMTDQYAIEFYDRLYAASAGTIFKPF